MKRKGLNILKVFSIYRMNSLHRYERPFVNKRVRLFYSFHKMFYCASGIMDCVLCKGKGQRKTQDLILGTQGITLSFS